jgi:hypothetical protein
MYSRRYYSGNRELDLDVERAALRVALLSNSSTLPIYPYYPSYNYLPSYSYYGMLPPYFGTYPYGPPYPYLYY